MSVGGEGAQKSFLEYYDKVFPFAENARGDTDQKMVEKMRKEVAKGPISFKPVSTDSPLNKAIQRLRLPDDFKQKLRNRRK
jgi:hypothetical protein